MTATVTVQSDQGTINVLARRAREAFLEGEQQTFDNVALALAYLERRYPRTYCCIIGHPIYGLEAQGRVVPPEVTKVFALHRLRSGHWQVLAFRKGHPNVKVFDPCPHTEQRLHRVDQLLPELARVSWFTHPLRLENHCRIGARGPNGARWSPIVCLAWVEFTLLGHHVPSNAGFDSFNLQFNPAVDEACTGAMDHPDIIDSMDEQDEHLIDMWPLRFRRMIRTCAILPENWDD